MRKVILIEGLDNVGKSTQIKKILENFPKNFKKKNVIHFTSPKDGRTETQIKTFVDIFYKVNDSKENFIFDRSHLGEKVYGPIYRKNKPDFIYGIEDCFEEMMNQSYLILFEDKVKNIIGREDGLSFSVKFLRKLHEKWRFRLAYWLSNVKHKIRISITNKSVEDVFLEVRKFLNEEIR